MILKYTATNKDSARTVYSVLRKELNISATMLRRLKSADAISVSGASVYTNYLLSPEETILVDINAAEEPCDNLPEAGEIEVLYENEGLLAVNKPSGILVHPSRSRNNGTLANFVAGYLVAGNEPCTAVTQNGRDFLDSSFSENLISDAPTPHAVNRLDRDTSGVVLFAKNSYMKAIASDAISKPDARKEYLALVYGEMPESGCIDVAIKRVQERNMLRIPAPDGQRAVTHFKTVRIFKTDGFTVSLVRLRLETGRTHQIRVHCLHIGRPILGDKLYCNENSMRASQVLGISTQALHAQLLAFCEPLSGDFIEISAPWNCKNYSCIFGQDMLAY